MSEDEIKKYIDSIYALKCKSNRTAEEEKLLKAYTLKLERLGHEYQEPEPEDFRGDENYDWSNFKQDYDEDREQEYNFYKERGKRRAEYEEKKKAKDRRYTRWFCTWPRRSTNNLNHVLEALDVNCETNKCAIRYYIIARETHEDGGFHTHAYFELTRRLYWNAHIWDLFIDDENADVWHGKYDGARSWKRCIQYLKKEGDYITNIDIKSARRKHTKAQVVLDMDPLDALDEGFINYLQLNQFVANQATYMGLKKKREPPKQCSKKRRHYWYYGVSNTGKTYMQREDMKKHPNDWFRIPYDDNWIGYKNQKYLYADEFKGQVTIQHLNSLCDGGTQLNVKYASAYLHDEPIIMICSNYCPEDCYHNANSAMIKTLLNRFNVIELTKIYEE
jgi:hypothetical protein